MSILSSGSRIAVTGGAGFIGSHVTELLIERGHDTVVIDDLSSGSFQNLMDVIDHPSVSIHQQDICIRDGLEQLLEGCDAIIHLAGLADIVPSIEQPSRYYDVNVTGTLNLLEAARSAGCKKIIYAASSTCYGIPKIYPTPETAKLSPQYPYALTKLLGEQLVLHWSQVYGIEATSLRLFNVYGPRVRTTGTYGAVMGVFLSQRANGQPLTIVGTGEQKRDFTHVKDVANAFVRATELTCDNNILNVGSGSSQSINFLASLIGGPVVFIPKRPGEPDITFADTALIKKALGWEASVSLEKGVAELLTDVADWESAPLWTEDSISKATRNWFKLLGARDA